MNAGLLHLFFIFPCRTSDEDRLYQLVRELIAISRPDTGLKVRSTTGHGGLGVVASLTA